MGQQFWVQLIGTVVGGLVATASAVGLQAGDDIDGLCVADSNGTFDAGDAVRFSLAPGSPTLAAIGFARAA